MPHSGKEGTLSRLKIMHNATTVDVAVIKWYYVRSSRLDCG